MAKSPDNKVEQPQHAVSHSTNRTDKIINIQPQHRPWIYAVVAVIALMIAFAIGVSAANHRDNRVFQNAKFTQGPGEAGLMPMGERHFTTGGGFGTGTGIQNRLTGVVTSVNGDTFTVAGGGSTNQVTTNSSTQYQNGSSVKVNDTVTVFGTISNNTLTATQIIVNP